MRLLAQRRAQAAQRWTTARSLQAILALLVAAAGTELVENHLAEQDSGALAQLSSDRAEPVAAAPSAPPSAPLAGSPSIDAVARTLHARRAEHLRASGEAQLVTLLVLIVAQLHLARATRRLLSPPLVLATGLTGLAALGGSEGRVALLTTGALILTALGLWKSWRELS